MHQHNFLILYGSETGKAESIAQLIYGLSEEHGYVTKLLCLSEVDKFDLSQESCVVFVSSTTGDGEQPENARKFFASLSRNNLDSNHLNGLQYTILGLGDTNYSQFCNGPKTLHRRLEELGGRLFYNPGWADDGLGLEIVVEPWVEGLWEALKHIKPGHQSIKDPKILPATEAPLPLKVETKSNAISVSEVEKLLSEFQKISITTDVEDGLLQNVVIPPGELSIPTLPPSYLLLNVVHEEIFDEKKHLSNWTPQYPLASRSLREVKIVRSRQLTEEGSHKTAFEITLDLADTDIAYEPGDSISIVCPNPTNEVELLIKRLGCSSFAHCTLTPCLSPSSKRTSKIPDFYPPNFSLHHLLKHVLDIRSVPKKTLLRVLAEYTSDCDERRCLEFICSRQGSAVCMERVRGGNLCLLDLLITFKSCSPPIEKVLEHLPRLMPRPYSCASYSTDSSEVDFVFNVVKIPAENGRHFQRKGICTGYLEEIILNHHNDRDPRVWVFARQNKNFRMPENIETPMIMIGPGTGVAPFRGFLQKRAHILQNSGQLAGESWLFYGCRNEDKDFIYKYELERHLVDGTLTTLKTCFSRDKSDSGLIYVQNCIEHFKDDFIRLVFDKNATIYVCGDAKNMAKDVNQMIITCTAKVLEISESDARSKVAELVVGGKYLQDVWG